MIAQKALFFPLTEILVELLQKLPPPAMTLAWSLEKAQSLRAMATRLAGSTSALNLGTFA